MSHLKNKRSTSPGYSWLERAWGGRGNQWLLFQNLSHELTCHQQEFLFGWWLLVALLLQEIWGSQSHKKALSLTCLCRLLILSMQQTSFAFSRSTRSTAHLYYDPSADMGNMAFPGSTGLSCSGQV